jgi:hypothetical protein
MLELRVVGKGEARYDGGKAVQARHTAVERAQADAILLAGLARCPRCGARQSAAVRKVIGHVALRLVLAAAVLGVAEWSEIDLAMFAALLVAWCLLVSAIAVNVRRFLGATKRVEVILNEAAAPARIIPITVVGSKLEMS